MTFKLKLTEGKTQDADATNAEGIEELFVHLVSDATCRIAF